MYHWMTPRTAKKVGTELYWTMEATSRIFQIEAGYRVANIPEHSSGVQLTTNLQSQTTDSSQ